MIYQSTRHRADILKSELREEVPLPPSGITHYDGPDRLPSPPQELVDASGQQTHPPVTDDDIVAEDEKGWFYYLADISYRRMMNRAILAMGRHGMQGWMERLPELMGEYRALHDQIDLW